MNERKADVNTMFRIEPIWRSLLALQPFIYTPALALRFEKSV
ncbi:MULTISPECIES: tellurite resistance protein [unclassified Brucella]|nr:tellurite resistance protein [Brucella sp. 2716]APY15928.1 tellurite resistance protein [Brucella sp. 09RB8910]OEI83414.1 tellurite resistance protein [Brucella sp. B13-0095]